MSVTNSKQPTTYPNFLVVLELLKPITWFPPMWAFACGVISSGISVAENLELFILGIIVAGPVVCGMSQAANDWCDRHVDTINEPNRPIPSGKIQPSEALSFGVITSILSIIILGLSINWLAASLLAFTIFFYAVVYTIWLKRYTVQNIVIGALLAHFLRLLGIFVPQVQLG